MIRNRSQIVMTSSPNSSDIESNILSNEKSSHKMMGGTKRWQYLIGVVVAAGILYGLVLFSSPAPLKEHKASKAASYEQLTIVMNTFKRHEMNPLHFTAGEGSLLQAIERYSSCHLVKHIYVVWSEEEAPPEHIQAKFAHKEHPSVTFRIEQEGTLNNRFRPIDGPHNDAIFSVDDDMRVPCEDLELAHEVWRGSQRSIVGFMPRIHIRRNGLLEYRYWWRVWWHGTYSIILTKAAILHHDFFAIYQSPKQKAVRELVDQRWNCEDIAMQFLIANETALPPIYVKGHIEDKGVLGGISTNPNIFKAGHMHDRSRCLDDLEKIYGGVPLVASRMIVDSAGNGWTNVPSTVYEYLSSDLWKW